MQFRITLEQDRKGPSDSETPGARPLHGPGEGIFSSFSHLWSPPLPHKLYESLSRGFTHIFIIYGQYLVTRQEFIIRGSACQREGGSTVSRCPAGGFRPPSPTRLWLCLASSVPATPGLHILPDCPWSKKEPALPTSGYPPLCLCSLWHLHGGPNLGIRGTLELHTDHGAIPAEPTLPSSLLNPVPAQILRASPDLPGVTERTITGRSLPATKPKP